MGSLTHTHPSQHFQPLLSLEPLVFTSQIQLSTLGYLDEVLGWTWSPRASVQKSQSLWIGADYCSKGRSTHLGR